MIYFKITTNKIFPVKFSKNIKISNFIKIHPLRAQVFPYGRTDIHKTARSRFSKFYKRAYKLTVIRHTMFPPDQYEVFDGPTPPE